MEACRESEEVVELLEQFLESGFTQETAAKNGELCSCDLKGQEGIFFNSGHLRSGFIYGNL